MTLEEKLVEALCAGDNVRVVELLKAGANPNHKTMHPLKTFIPHPVHVARVALDHKNYHGVLCLLDHGALANDASLRWSVEKLAAMSTSSES